MKSQILNRQHKTLKDEPMDLLSYFHQPISARQKQYGAVRAVVVEQQSAEAVAERFGYTSGTVYSLVRDAKAGKLDLFPTVSKGPQGRRTDREIQQHIAAYRRQGLSCEDIALKLAEDGAQLSARTVERLLKAAGFSKFPQRTHNA
ncbi:MAG: hypothetical protein GY801_38580 [bacterium]|nr:hypothetical protein [bacterium]